MTSLIKIIDDMDKDKYNQKYWYQILSKIYDSLIETHKIPLSEVQSD